MQSATTETFSVSFPPVYDHIRIAWESIQGEHREDDGYLSYTNIGLTELSFYDKYEGDDLVTRFRASCLEQRGPVEVILDKTLPVAGLTAHIRIASSSDGYYYYFALLQISGEYGYSFIGDCDTKNRAHFEPLFDALFQSLQYFGDPATAMRKQKEAIDAIFSKYNTTTPAEDAVEKTFEPFVVPEREFWQIGEETFSFSKPAECHISDGDGAFYVRIDAAAPAGSAVINDYEHEQVYLQFYFKGIYKAGVPTGKFKFEDEREGTYLAYLWKGGFEYSQSLTAEVTLLDGWLGIEGYFNEQPVKLAIKLDTADLKWEQYRFLSAEEVGTASPKIVQTLWLTNPYAGILEETIYPLTELRLLGIVYTDEKLAADFKEVPKAIKRLKELRDLSLTGVSALDSLPTWLGDLKQLEIFRLANSRVEGIHPYILQLPELQKLYLSNNQLGAIHQALPEKLETLTLAHNQLKTVPASVSKLLYLNIEDNPLVSFPDSINQIEKLDLELEKKMTLLDYSYKGANGEGVVPYDDSRFLAKHDADLLEVLEGEIGKAGLEQFKAGLVNRTRHAVGLATTDEDTYDTKGAHRFGGLPDLPAGTSYPTFINWEQQEKGMQFLAQINCTEIAHLQDYLPRTGLLLFFITDQEDLKPEVIYYDGDLSTLQSAKELDIDPDFIDDQHGIYTPFKAIAGKYPGMPNTYNASQLYPELQELEEMYDETDALSTGLKSHSVLPVHSMNSYVFKQHDTPEIEAVDVKKGKPEEWMVLLRVSSDANTGFSFWDAGEIYFVIHKSDLEKKDFRNVFCGLESS